jgi:hypothetical protein
MSNWFKTTQFVIMMKSIRIKKRDKLSSVSDSIGSDDVD